MSSNVFLPKKQASDWLTYQFYQLEAWVFLAGNHLNSYVSLLTLISEKTYSFKSKKKEITIIFLVPYPMIYNPGAAQKFHEWKVLTVLY